MSPADAAALSAALPAPADAVHYVRIPAGIFAGKSSPFWQAGGRVTLPLPGGEALVVRLTDSEMLGANRFVSRGEVEGHAGSRAVFAVTNGFLSGNVEIAGHSYALRPATESLEQFYEIDPRLVPPCGGTRQPVVDAAVLAAAQARHQRAAELAAAAGTSAPVPQAAEAAQSVEIHVLMAYTTAVKPTLSGAARTAALQSEFDAAIAKMNNELAASQVAARVKLVGIAETAYDESASAPNQLQNDALTALYKTDDGKMDELHATRDRLGADVVCLVLAASDPTSIGLSFVLASPAAVDASAGMTNPLFAFSVVQYGTIAGTDVVSHELGHVLGCAHARGDPGANGTRDGAYTYSYGYRFFGTDSRQYHDIMAYSPGAALSYYSNPNVTVPAPVGAPIGVAPGQPNEADCALTIDRNAFEVSTYRLQTAATPAGTLVNVATRAYIGPGDQVLIGGFVIDGTQPKRVLVRAAGPALGGFGVTNALADPRLTVHAGNSTFANDNWDQQANAADIAAAGAQAGAFPFRAGSADSALLLTLAPGSYTAVVEGAGGAAGSGLVEVYDVDRVGNKIVNLATRGYADVGREMFAGFVVQGAAGTTKRVLIRVLGPTLEHSYGVTGAMYDPMLELHNAAGDTLVKNDDWSSGDSAGSVSTVNDFTPWVKTYSEQQIAATGFAPSNRREPCVLVDLPPGAYSAVVQPFANADATPPQPAQPGVALVEVYEINP